MKRLFSLLGLLIVISIGFMYTEQTMSVVRERDEIMIKIKEETENKIDSIDSIIEKNTIIPGISGREININESYKKMKQYGKYNENLLIYNKIKPNNSLEKNKDKYIISGNPKKQMVSLIFIGDNYIDEILKYNININLFVKEIDKINDKTLVGFYEKYDDWLNSLVRSNNREANYCFIIDKDYNCIKNNKYLIKTDVIKNNFLINTKKQLKSGSIITYKINKDLLKELNLIINYINSKGLSIELLDTLLEE